MSLDSDLDEALRRQDEAARTLACELETREAFRAFQQDLVLAAREHGKVVVNAAIPLLVKLLLAAI